MTKEEKRFRKMQEQAIEAKQRRIEALKEKELEEIRAKQCHTPECIKALPCDDHPEAVEAADKDKSESGADEETEKEDDPLIDFDELNKV